IAWRLTWSESPLSLRVVRLMSDAITALAPAPDPRPGPALIRLERVAVQFGRQRVLHDVSLDIGKGQTLGVIGESGCGKTVLLKLIIGLLRPNAGRAVFDGRELAALGERELTRQRLRFGFLFQGAALFDSLNVFDNVAFGLREQRRPGEPEIRERVRQRL